MANTPNNPQRNPSDFGTTGTRFGATGSTSSQQNIGGSATERAKDTGSTVAEKARDVASNLSEQARDTMSSLGQRAGDVASSLQQKAQDAASAVADKWEEGKQYVMDQGFSGLAEDLTTLIRRNPIPALLIGFGLGFLLARTFRD